MYPLIKQNKKHYVKIQDFNGGINKSESEVNIEDNQAVEITNMWYKDGALKTRNGFEVIYKNADAEPEPFLTTDMKDTNLYGFSTSEVGYYSCVKTGNLGAVEWSVKFPFKVCYTPNKAEQNGIPLSVVRLDTGEEIDFSVNSKEILSVFFGEYAGDYKVCNMITYKSDADLFPNDTTEELIKGNKESRVKTYPYNIQTSTTRFLSYFSYMDKVHNETFQRFLGFSIQPQKELDGEYLIPTQQYEVKLSPSIYLEMKGSDLPVIKINGTPDGGGDIINDYNIVKDSYVEKFSTTETDTIYIIGTDDASTVDLTYTKDNGTSYRWILPDGISQESNGVTATLYKNKITFSEALGKNITRNTLIAKVSFKKDVFKAQRETLSQMQLSAWFGGARSGISGGTRLFLAGCPNEPNLIRWSELDNPFIFPENNFAYVGESTGKITALAKQGNFLVIFKENETFIGEYNWQVDSNNKSLISFPLTPISPNIGCDCPKTIQTVNDRLVWCNSKGYVYILQSSDQYSEMNIQEISKNIRPLLLQEGSNLKMASSIDYQGNYLLATTEGNVYVWNYDLNPYINYTSSEKANNRLVWFKWQLWTDSVYDLFDVNGKISAIVAADYGEYAPDPQYTYRNMYFYVARMNDIDYDEYWRTNQDLVDNHNVKSTYKSKLWNLGTPQNFKRIRKLFLAINAKKVFNLTVKSITEKGETQEVVNLTNATSFDVPETTFAVRPNINRARLYGFTIETENPIEILSATINFETLGEVR